ncbi:mPR-like GPCR protein [Xylariaceae sp. FL0255]|nr:mPR-like GPCR protein [Xylariaceae sp. FL0255]
MQSGTHLRPSTSTLTRSEPRGKPQPEVVAVDVTAGHHSGVSPRRLLTWDEIPEWCRDDEFVRTGYRPISRSARKSFASLFYMHNETINILTHLLPAIASLLSGWYIVQSYLDQKYPDLKFSDYVVFGFFFLSATCCLGLSAAYHALCNHSFPVASLWLRVDLVGIVVLTLGDFVSGIYVGFWCEPFESIGLLGNVGTASIFIMLSPDFEGPKWRTFRVLTFVATGLSGFVPLAHGVYLFGIPQMMKQSDMPYYLVEGLFLILGALVYTTRVPERFSSGTFDKCGVSHQIFHVLVVLATITQVVGILSAFDYNYHHRVCLIH